MNKVEGGPMNFERTDYRELVSSGLVLALDQDLMRRYEVPVSVFNDDADPELGAYQALILYVQDVPVACGCFRSIDVPETNALVQSLRNECITKALRVAELARIFVASGYRGKENGGIAVQLIKALESWAKEQGYHCLVLKTADKQLEAIRLYERLGWEYMPLYGSAYPKGTTLTMAKRLGI